MARKVSRGRRLVTNVTSEEADRLEAARDKSGVPISLLLRLGGLHLAQSLLGERSSVRLPLSPQDADR